MNTTRLAVIDTGQVNERILNKDEYRADFRKVEGASLKRTTHLSSPHAKRMFARCFYSFQASMYFISQLGRAKLDHEVVERIEQNIREALDAATDEINKAIDQAEALLKHHNIETLASYDTVPLQEQIGITSSFPLMAAATFIVGVSDGAGMVIWGTLLQRRVPIEMLGRVSSLDFFVSLAFMPLSFAIAGPLSKIVSMQTIFLVAGVVPVLAAAVAMTAARMRRDEIAHPLR